MLYELSADQRQRLIDKLEPTAISTYVINKELKRFNIEYFELNDPHGKYYMGGLEGEEKDINWFLLQL